MVKFGTGGWRAIIGEEFTKENIQKLALAICLKMKAEGVDGQGVVMGYDRRFLSKEAIIWSCEIFGNQGIRVWFVNRSSPTPLVMFYVMKHELSYGMMVTASHNPAIYNGIKVFTYGGRDADEKQTAEIEYYLEQAEGLYLPNEEENGQMPPPSYLDRYCDIGIATDGDADRLGVIDDQGHYLHANNILVMLYYYLLKYKGWRGPAVRNLATTHVLDKVAESFGQKCYEVPVGFKHISAKMQETDAIIGGESSGGLTVKGHIHGKDGIYAAALLVEMIAVSGKRLSEIAADIRKEYGAIHMAERDYRFTPEEKERIHNILMVERKLPEMPFETDHVSYMDGCKVYFKNGGWVIARFSGTEPLLRIFCEMEHEPDTVRVCNLFEEYLGL